MTHKHMAVNYFGLYREWSFVQAGQNSLYNLDVAFLAWLD